MSKDTKLGIVLNKDLTLGGKPYKKGFLLAECICTKDIDGQDVESAILNGDVSVITIEKAVKNDVSRTGTD